MKFEYDDVTSEYEEMAAFIDNAGDLCIRVYGDEGAYLIGSCGVVYSQGKFEDYAKYNGVKKAFYPGDKITIAF